MGETKEPKIGFHSASEFWKRSLRLGYWFCCNGDVQFKDRVVPADVVIDGCGAAEPATSEPSGTGGLFFGSRSFSALKKEWCIVTRWP